MENTLLFKPQETLDLCFIIIRFVIVDVGGYGRQSDGGTFKASVIGQMIEKNVLPLPDPSCLPETPKPVPYVFIGDEAFQLKTNFMRPFPGKNLETQQSIFNYRLSRARRCVENAFGILCSRWRVFRRTINVIPEHADNIVKAACVLHNFLRYKDETNEEYCPPGYADTEINGTVIPGRWREESNSNCDIFLNLPATKGQKYCKHVAAIRNQFAQYFCSNVGSVPWQWQLLGVNNKS